jgi:NhaP-type Na+/H+ or K+/H+ antiporter
VSTLNLLLFAAGALTLALALGAAVLRRRVRVVSEPMLATALGVALGPVGLGLVDLGTLGEPLVVVEQTARLTLGVAVVATALRLPSGYVRRHARTLALLLGPTMLLMWAASGLLAWAALDLGLWTALLVGAALTPTDPVLAGTTVAGPMAEENVPARVRHAVSAEAGANDGAAYLLVFLPLLVLTLPPVEALATWALHVALWEVAAAVALGYALGWSVGQAQDWLEDRGLEEQTSALTGTLALTAVALAGVRLLGSDGVLAAFAAGLGFNRAARRPEEEEQADVQEAVNRLFAVPAFVVFGLALPWADWAAFGWGKLLALAVLVLALRRLPAVFALRRRLPPLRHRADALFVGWFGPVGVAAVFYAALAAHRLGDATVWTVVSFVVLASVVVFGVTSTPLTLLYGRRYGPDADG